jgi:heptosyltransferase-2
LSGRGAGTRAALGSLKAILVVRLDEIGDVVMNSPFLRELRRNAPQAWITLVVKPGTLNLVERCPYANEVLAFDWRAGVARALRLHGRALRLAATRLWRRRFDLAINPRWGADHYHGIYLTYFSGAPRRVGYSEGVCLTKREMNAGCDRMFTDLLTDASPRHEVERNLDVIRFLGGDVVDSGLEVWLDEQDREFAAQTLAQHRVDAHTLLIALAAGAGAPKRYWPIERFVELGCLMLREYRPRLLIVGGRGDAQLGERFEAELGDRVINLAGRTTLRQTAALLQRCHLAISNDSGPMHLAAATGTPLLAISCHPRGGAAKHENSPVMYGPWGTPHLVLQPEQPRAPCRDGCESDQPHCILGVSVDDAFDAARQLLVATMGVDATNQNPRIPLA